jgi:hypothetical protein
MADNSSVDIAIADLDELVDRLGPIIKRNGFDPKHKTVIWMLKAWLKIGVLANHTEYPRLPTGYYVMKRGPAPMAGSRIKALLRDLEGFQTVLERDKTTHGDYFKRVDDGMRDFVWDYRKHLTGSSATDSESQLVSLMSMSKDRLMKETLFKMDQHA